MRLLLLIAVFAIAFIGCKETTKNAVDTNKAGNVATAPKGAAEIEITNDNTQLKWYGTKLVGSGHNGTVQVAGGAMRLTDGNIVAGEFEIDMKSITNTDIEKVEMQQKLAGHLSSPDFFDVAQYPNANFSVTKVSASEGGNGTHMVSGNLKIKDQTHEISFPATIKTEGGKLSVIASFSIDRNKWGINYGNSTIKDIAKDRIINDNIDFELTIDAPIGS